MRANMCYQNIDSLYNGIVVIVKICIIRATRLKKANAIVELSTIEKEDMVYRLHGEVVQPGEGQVGRGGREVPSGGYIQYIKCITNINVFYILHTVRNIKSCISCCIQTKSGAQRKASPHCHHCCEEDKQLHGDLSTTGNKFMINVYYLHITGSRWVTYQEEAPSHLSPLQHKLDGRHREMGDLAACHPLP